MDMAIVKRMALVRNVIATVKKTYLVSHVVYSLRLCLSVYLREENKVEKTCIYMHAPEMVSGT